MSVHTHPLTTLLAALVFGAALLGHRPVTGARQQVVTGGETLLVLRPSAVPTLAAAGITLKPTAPANMDPASGSVRFPVVAGSIGSHGSVGSVRLAGGVIVANRFGKGVTIGDPVLDVSSGYITATVNGQSETVVRLGSLRVTSRTRTDIAMTSDSASFFSAFAFELNDDLQTGAVVSDVAMWSATVALTLS